MVKRRLKVKYGKAEYECIFEQNTVRGCSYKTLIALPNELDCRTIRAHNAFLFAQYLLGKEIQQDESIFDRCYTNTKGWEYDIEGGGRDVVDRRCV